MIAIYCPSLRGGGAERVMFNLACELNKRRISVDMVLVKAEGRYLDDLPREVRVIDLASSGVSTSLPGLVRYLSKEKPDSLLSTQIHANVIALLAKRLSGVSTRIVVREANIVKVSRKAKITLRKLVILTLARYFYPSANGVVAVSQGVAEDLMKNIGVPRDRIVVIYNPVVMSDLNKLASEKVNHPWLGSGAPPFILGVGRLSEQKDFETLIRAFKMVRQKMFAKLIILGEGELRPDLEALVNNLGLDKDVNLPGHVANPFAFLKKASVYVLSSRWEGLPNSLIEALAIGVPVIATDCHSGPREILAGGKYGKLLPVGATEDIATSVMDVILKRNIPMPNSKALELYNLDVCVDSYLRILNHNRLN